MKTIELENATIKIMDENIVLFEAKSDKTVDSKAAKHFYNLIEQSVSGEYTIIINRKNKYQLMRFEVFNVINEQNRLKGLAVVTKKDIAKKMADLEAPLCKKPFETFYNIDDAINWCKAIQQG